MVEDTYRRPRRVYSPDESYAEKFNRYFSRKGPGKLMETIYPKDLEFSKERKGDPRTIYPSAKERKENEKKSGLVKKLGVVSAALLAGSALLVTPNITGNVIWGLSSESTNMIGIVFFVLGVAGLLFALKQK